MSGKRCLVLGLLALSIARCAGTPREAPSNAVDPDLQVIRQLEEAGSNLAVEHPVEFFLYFPTKEAAEAAGSHLEQSGYAVRVRPAAAGSEWLCQATRLLRPDHRVLAAIRSDLEALAHRLDGEYDGWGTPVVH